MEIGGEGDPTLSSYKGYDKGPFGYKTGVRQYDPETGRFLSPDPFKGYITDPASQHPYMYCRGNPISYADPSGYDIRICYDPEFDKYKKFKHLIDWGKIKEAFKRATGQTVHVKAGLSKGKVGKHGNDYYINVICDKRKKHKGSAGSYKGMSFIHVIVIQDNLTQYGLEHNRTFSLQELKNYYTNIIKHEIAHAAGRKGHSKNYGDLMYEKPTPRFFIRVIPFTAEDEKMIKDYTK